MFLEKGIQVPFINIYIHVYDISVVFSVSSYLKGKGKPQAFYCISILGICVISITFVLCCQVWRDFYMVIVFALAMVTLALQVHPRYLSPSWSTYRMMLYSSLAAYGIIPSIHWVYLSGGLQADVVQVIKLNF